MTEIAVFLSEGPPVSVKLAVFKKLVRTFLKFL